MNSHLDFTKLNEYLDNQLNKDEMEVVRAHLEKCAHCRQELEQLAALRESLSGQLAQVLTGLKPRVGWQKRLIRRFQRSRLQRYSPIIALGAVALLLVALYLPLEQRTPRQEPGQLERFSSPESFPTPDKEMRLFGLDQPGGPQSEIADPVQVRVFSSDDPAQVDQVFAALEKANLRPIRRGKEILVERINLGEAESIIDELIR